MPWRLTTVLPLTAAAAVAAAASVSLREPPGRASASPPRSGASAEAVDVLPASVPNRGNVSHGLRVEIAALEARLDSAPGDTAALARLGSLLGRAHQPAAAIPYLERYAAINPGNRELWLQLATSYGDLGNWGMALEVTMATLARWPDDPAAMYNAGAIHANRGDYELAESWWERVRVQGADSGLAELAVASLSRLPTSRP